MKPGQFVKESFNVPEKLETDEFRLRMLTVNDVEKDYDAVMSSIDQLKEIWPDADWPEGLTREKNLEDLDWHQGEFLTRSSFTYTVVALDETRVLGCVYIYPTKKHGYDAEVYLWARETKLGTGLDTSLYDVVKHWLKSEWPFENAAFPGRDIKWDIWNTIPNKKD